MKNPFSGVFQEWYESWRVGIHGVEVGVTEDGEVALTVVESSTIGTFTERDATGHFEPEFAEIIGFALVNAARRASKK